VKLLSIFCLLPELFPCTPKKLVDKLYAIDHLRYFHFCKDCLITTFVEILKNIAKFLKDLIFTAEISAKRLCEILTKLLVL